MDNTIWLVDVGYVTKASKGRGKVDYIETKKFLESKFNKLCIPILFNSIDRSRIDIGLTQFYYTIKKAGFMVNLYEMEGGMQKQVDVAIGAHLVYYALKGCTIVLSSGDIDFLPAIQVAQKDDSGINITLLTFDFGVHEKLSELASAHLLFEDYPQILRIR